SCDRPAHALFVERPLHFAGVEHPLLDLQPQITRNERVRRWHVEVVAVGLVAVAEEKDVWETPRMDDPDLRAVALDDRVGGDRRAVDEEVDVAEGALHVQSALQGERLDAAEDRLLRRTRGARRLVDAQAPLAVDRNEVGKRAADVDADSHTHSAILPRS